jgi:hypothetical protein
VVLTDRIFAGERLQQRALVAFVQERENFDHALAEDFIATVTRDPFHRAIPRNEAQFTVEREDAIDARVDKTA